MGLLPIWLLYLLYICRDLTSRFHLITTNNSDVRMFAHNVLDGSEDKRGSPQDPTHLLGWTTYSFYLCRECMVYLYQGRGSDNVDKVFFVEFRHFLMCFLFCFYYIFISIYPISSYNNETKILKG